MPTILDAGTTQLSNADVLYWIRSKRAQHHKEDEEDSAAGRPVMKRPHRFLDSLRKHERELTDKKYPYAKNPGAYNGVNRQRSVDAFVELCDAEISVPHEEQLATKMSANQLRVVLPRELDKKTLTNTELLMIQNLAPENVSMLELIIEDCDERFTADEMEKLVDITDRVFRCGAEMQPAS